MNDLNIVTLIGNLTKDPELKYTPNGTAVASFSLASNSDYKKNGEEVKRVSFINCIAWAKAGEIITQYAKKGDKLGVSGRLQQRSWEDQNGNKRSVIEVVVNDFQFLSNKKKEESIETKPDEAKPDPEQKPFESFIKPFEENPFDDIDIPF